MIYELKNYNKKLKIYLDNCCLNRPFDDQSQIKIELETRAKIYIQQLIKDDKLEMVTSFMLRFENSVNPFDIRRDAISDFINKYSSQFIGSDKLPELNDKISEIKKSGIKQKDAVHIACAIFAGCSYLLTTDKRMLNFKSCDIKIINPVDFILELEEV
ncbi:MAG: hypothetical protein IJQ63_05990 [Synergistaceae bacterium]|nr:hypothetical protein [Synergistaceae bacterium]MBQ9896412.1 hypothetical protein [Synergistaceae bacterium]MBR0097492.1 hypothetical protein [Synergistaceae bacterium]MBR0221306.1 hypothetical protein [Synergistaceae bacterium]